MKKHYYLIALLVLLFSCNAKEELVLPVDKIYVFEFNHVPTEYFESEEGGGYLSKFQVFGFSELSKDYELMTASLRKDSDYCTSYSYLPDSIRETINTTILNYPADTASFSFNRPVIYDGNHFLIVIESVNTNRYIAFIPYCLPEDLSYFYDVIYEQRINDMHKYKQCDTIQLFNEYVDWFESIVLDSVPDLFFVKVPPPPIGEEPIQFIPPVVSKE